MRRRKCGWIEVICGSMFSGKTEELMRRLRRAQLAGQGVEIFKPAVDTRYSHDDVVSHNANSMCCTPVDSPQQILLLAGGVQVVGIDEAQFLDAELPAVCEALAKQGARVIVAGLDMDFQGKGFGPMPALLATAEHITKLHAICMVCGDPALFSYRTSGGAATILLGETDKYEARCRECFYEGSAA